MLSSSLTPKPPQGRPITSRPNRFGALIIVPYPVRFRDPEGDQLLIQNFRDLKHQAQAQAELTQEQTGFSRLLPGVSRLWPFMAQAVHEKSLLHMAQLPTQIIDTMIFPTQAALEPGQPTMYAAYDNPGLAEQPVRVIRSRLDDLTLFRKLSIRKTVTNARQDPAYLLRVLHREYARAL